MSVYANKPHLHVAVDSDDVIGVFTHDGEDPIATCVDLPTAHLFALAPQMLAVLEAVASGTVRPGDYIERAHALLEQVRR